MLKKENKPRLKTKTTTTTFEFNFEKWITQNLHIIIFFGVIGIWAIAIILLFQNRGCTESGTDYNQLHGIISIIGDII